jgi:hypothetical protein
VAQALSPANPFFHSLKESVPSLIFSQALTIGLPIARIVRRSGDLPVSVEEILELLESISKEYRELSEALVPPERTIPRNNRISSEVALEVAIALEGVIEKIRSAR